MHEFVYTIIGLGRITWGFRFLSYFTCPTSRLSRRIRDEAMSQEMVGKSTFLDSSKFNFKIINFPGSILPGRIALSPAAIGAGHENLRGRLAGCLQ